MNEAGIQQLLTQDDLNRMSPAELRAELSRLRRSQAGNLAEDPWNPATMGPKLQKVQSLLESNPFGPVGHEDLHTMSRPQLQAELSRLRRSQAGNPTETPWDPQTMFPRLQKAESLLKSNPFGEGGNEDLDKMTPKEVQVELSRLQRSQGGNPDETPWNPKTMLPRLEKAQALLKSYLS